MSKKPHILLVTTDELRKDALSCYGNEAVSTPNIDRLAAEGVRFDRAYAVSPWCLPSRCAILTGLYPHRSGAYSNFRKCELSADIPNLFSVLGKHGYRTAMFGKCHFAPVPYGDTRADRTLPYDAFKAYYESLGIDHLELQDDKQVSVWFYDDYAKELDRAGYLEAYRRATWDVEEERRKVFRFPGPAEWHPDSWVGRKAEAYIDRYEEDAPLFAWVSFSGPHYPFDPPAEYLDRVDMSKDAPRRLKPGEFDDPARIHYRSWHGPGNIDGCHTAPDGASKNYTDTYWQRLRRNYYANLAQIDDYVGRVIEAARSRLGDDLLVIFTADHGEMLGHHGVWGKHDCAYEDVINVPLLVQFPDRPAPQTTDARVMLTGMLATCLAAAGLPAERTDGRDFRACMEDGGYAYTFAEGEGFASVSDGTYKYVYTNKEGQEYAELFDRSADPDEFDNALDRPELAAELARLRGQLIRHLMPKVLA